ncbi:hypothetical protein ACS0TY_009834 [Phlomoides rotata]
MLFMQLPYNMFILTVPLLAALMIYIGLQWCLTYTIVVLESTWGFAPLKRSSYLAKGIRRVGFLMMMLFGIPFLVMLLCFSNVQLLRKKILNVTLAAAVEFYIVLQWCLMYPIVVMESMWGFAPLRRSSYLVNGMRRVVFLMMMLLGIPSLIASMWYTNLMANVNEGRTGWVLVQMVVYAGLVTMLSLYNIVADTVLFVYCKELHGETVSRINEKPGGEYVKVPLDVV